MSLLLPYTARLSQRPTNRPQVSRAGAAQGKSGAVLCQGLVRQSLLIQGVVKAVLYSGGMCVP